MSLKLFSSILDNSVLFARVVSSIKLTSSLFPFFLFVKARAASNQIYVPELDRIVLGDKRGTRNFLNVKVSVIFSHLSSLSFASFCTIASCDPTVLTFHLHSFTRKNTA